MEKVNSLCPLCGYQDSYRFFEDENRIYLHCNNCDLVFVPKRFHISINEEKKKYDNHQNSPENRGYVNFLNRLLIPLQHHIHKDTKGLDFGSGPGPTLSVLMKERGFEMDIYDIFYAKNGFVFQNRYDFITMTEVIEHLKNPLYEIDRLWHLLHTGGILAIMTAFRADDFKDWYYKRDPTHIRFFTSKTFKWLARKLNGEILYMQNGVIIIKKRENRT